MTTIGAPDLITSTRLARDLAQVNRDLSRVSGELSTGLRDDPVAASGGDPGRIYALDRDLASIEARRLTISLAESRSATTQSALGRIADASGDLGVKLSSAAELRDLPGAVRAGAGARGAFETAISALNARFGERSLFAGAAVAGPAVADADVILAEVAARVAGAADATAALAAVDDYFLTDPTGFETTGYLGSTSDAPSVELGEGERLQYGARADDDALRTALAALAKGVIAAENAAPGLTDDERLALFEGAGAATISAGGAVIDLQAELGQAEERIETAAVGLEAQRTVLERTRNAILSRDPFETATEFTALETQLQSMFAVVSRLSSLSLTNFLR